MTRIGGLFVALASAAQITFAPAGSANAADVTLRLHHFTPPVAAMHQKFLLPWTKRVEEQSGGLLKVDIYPSMQLGGKPPQLVDQFRDGVVDLGWTLPGYTPGRFPRLEVFELPFVHTTPSATNMALLDFHDMHLREEMKDYKVLLLHVHAGNVVITRKTPIRRLEDFEGLKIRTPSRTGSWFLESLGATPIGTSITEVSQLLSRGVIDGAMVPFEIVWPFKMHEMTRFHTDIPGDARMQTSIFFFGMNKKRYNELPADLRKVIDDTTGRALAPIAAKVWEAAELPGINAAKERGNEFIELSESETARIRTASEAAIRRWLGEMKDAGIDGDKLLADARALVAKYAK